MTNKQLPSDVLATIKSWKGFEGFDGTEIDYLTKAEEVFEGYANTTLMEAVEREDVEVVAHLIQAGANVNAVNKGTRQTPLLFIPEKSEKALEISKGLIAAGADVNYIQTFGSSVDRFLKDTDGDDAYGLVKELLKTKDASQYFNSPLKDACENGDYELVKELLKAGADVNLRWGNGPAAICTVDSESKSYINILKSLIDAGADVNDSGGAPLRSAIYNSNLKAIRLLVSSGARADAFSSDDCNGKTPFMCFLEGKASDLDEEEEREVFFLLLTNAGDINIQDNDGRSLIFYTLNPHVGMTGDYDQEIFDKILYNPNIIINLIDNDGNTVLNKLLLSIEATDEFSDDEQHKIESLLIAGSDIEIRNNNGDSPKIIARRLARNDYEFGSDVAPIIAYLEADSYLSTSLANGEPPLINACVSGQVERVQWLLHKNAYVNQKSLTGKTALMLSDNLKIIRLLIVYGAASNERDMQGNTVLMVYAECGWFDGVKEIIRAGADPNKTNKWKETALIIAKKGRQAEITRVLNEVTTNKVIPSILSPFLCMFR